MNKNNSSRVHVRPVRRDPPDVMKLAKALIALAQSEAAREQQDSADRRDGEDGTGEEAA